MSNDFGKEFDDKMVEHLKALSKGALPHLQAFLEEITYREYDTVSQIIGALHTRIEVLKGRCDD